MSTSEYRSQNKLARSDGNLRFFERRPTLARIYREALFDDLIPWWQEHSIDEECGGYFTRLARDGKPYCDDKDVWMIGRQIWMFAHLYNTHEPRPLWREIAAHGMTFLRAHCFRPHDKMYFRVTRKGRPRATALSLYTRVFAAIAMAEYSQAAACDETWQGANKIYQSLMEQLGRPSDTPLLGYPLQFDFQLHSHQLCKMTVAAVFHRVAGTENYLRDVHDAARLIVDRHWKPDRGALLENVDVDGQEVLDIPEGQLLNPGHAIESAWMMMEIANATGDLQLHETSVEIVLASLNRGWDQEYGGIRYLLNLDGTPCHNIEADCKLWWPHSEALYACLLAWKETGRQDLADWYERIHDYTFSQFPDREYGEWYGYLNRDGSLIWTAKANGWKGCFHIPRVLYRCSQILE